MSALKSHTVKLLHEEFILHRSKVIYQPSCSMLICADIHIGKVGHFRSNGIALPRLVNKNNFWKLSEALDFFNPSSLMVVGDMVHSKENHEWDEFWDFLDNYPHVSRILVRGNHELYDDEVYAAHGFEVRDVYEKDGIIFTHEPMEEVPEGCYNIAGHVHPAIRMHGAGKQHLRLPCFWFGVDQAVLPSFGAFTGSKTIQPKRGDRVFVVTDEAVVDVSG
jgi:uncharacterized protein